MAVKLTAKEGGVWSATVPLAQGLAFEYKFIRVAADGTLNWERDPNRNFKIQTGCEKTASIDTDFLPQ